MGKFNSDEHYVYYCGQESHRRNGIAFIINKSQKCSTWVQPQKLQNDLFSFQHHSNTSLCPYHKCWRSWSWSVLWRPRRTPRTNTKKDIPFITGDWNTKVGSQEIAGVISKFGLGWQNEAGQRLTEFCKEKAPVIANNLFQQCKRWLYTWTSQNGQYWDHIDYILCSWNGEAYTVSKNKTWS